MATKQETAIENWRRYAYARDNGHRDYVTKANLCRRFFIGKHWDEAQAAILKASGRPVLTINKVFSTMMTIMGEQIATGADISFQPTASGNQETADALSKLWLSIARANKFTMVEETVFAQGAITSRGFYDVRIGFDDNMRGEVRIRAGNGKNIVIDPDAEEYDPNTWKEQFTTKWLSLTDIELLYGSEFLEPLKGRQKSNFDFGGYDSIDQDVGTFGRDPEQRNFRPYTFAGNADENLIRNYRIIERQHKQVRMREHFVDVLTGDTRPIPDNWDHNRISFIAEQYDLAVLKKKATQIRWTTSIDDILLFDEWSPSNWFTAIPFFPVFYEGETIGLVENLLSPQEQLNKISSQELHIVNTTANSGWKVKSGALQNMDVYELENRGAETGIVFELDDVNNLEKISPNQTPTGLDRLAFKADDTIKDLSGISDSQRGFDRADVAAKAIRAKQQAGSVNMTKPFQNLLHSRHLVASAALDLVQTYYTEERVIKVNGNGLLGEAEEVTLNGTSPTGDVVNDLQAGEYEVVVTDVPKRETFEEAQFDEATRLRELGVNIPDDILVEASHLRNKGEVAQRIREINGDAEPSDIQNQLAQLELQAAQLANELTTAEVMAKKADAALQLVRAQGEALSQGDESEAEAAQTKLLIEAEESRADIQRKQDELASNIQIKRDELRENMRIKRQEAAEKVRLERALAEERIEIMRSEAEAKIALAKQAEANKPKPKAGSNGDG